jgi:hypothetical protein
MDSDDDDDDDEEEKEEKSTMHTTFVTLPRFPSYLLDCCLTQASQLLV